jgi:hypothetical protein
MKMPNRKGQVELAKGGSDQGGQPGPGHSEEEREEQKVGLALVLMVLLVGGPA